MARLSLVAAALLALAGRTAAADEATPNRIALEVSPVTLDEYFGGEYFANDGVSSTSLGVAYERALDRHVAAGAVLTYVQPGTMVLPFLPGLRFREGVNSDGALRAASRLLLAEVRLRLVLPIAGDAGELGLTLQGGAAFLFYPRSERTYRGWGKAGEVGVDATWFWSAWGAAVRLSAGMAFTEAARDPGDVEHGPQLDRLVPLAVGLALVRRF